MVLFSVWVAMGALVGWLARMLLSGSLAFTVGVGVIGGIVGGLGYGALGHVAVNNGPTTNGVIVSLLGAVAATAFAQATLHLWRSPRRG